MALFGIGVVFGPIIGPTLGGWITDNWGWPWVFYINIPVGILYRNPDVPCYEDLRRSDKLRTPELTRTGLNAELDKYTVWPQAAAPKAGK